jgi:hypothetical protein
VNYTIRATKPTPTLTITFERDNGEKVEIMVQELSVGGCRLGQDFLRLLLKHTHRADVWDWPIANARHAEPG